MGPSILTMKTWQQHVAESVDAFVFDDRRDIDHSHLMGTPVRVVKAYEAMVAGENEDPKEILKTRFDSHAYDQMVWRRGIRVMSTCAHHLYPFIGKATFAYIPGTHIVGISKIPRLIQCFAKRLQVQERLTEQIVDAFYDLVNPLGCGLYIRAYHFCEIARGVEEHAAATETTALRGCFKTNPETRMEFLNMLDKQETIFP